jgi:hypothetical protein
MTMQPRRWFACFYYESFAQSVGGTQTAGGTGHGAEMPGNSAINTPQPAVTTVARPPALREPDDWSLWLMYLLAAAIVALVLKKFYKPGAPD